MERLNAKCVISPAVCAKVFQFAAHAFQVIILVSEAPANQFASKALSYKSLETKLVHAQSVPMTVPTAIFLDSVLLVPTTPTEK